ncbi:AcvB/VirJ family lysyl-phosphatidylglycerol hydrolase, partial [Escherichia coli]|uniref:AcvB/VirJ family lysyl-phosphatidylglycerol hydrolase n=1 Tax=Escherichia coli TaxID=562 RepID=UPI0018F036C9
RPPCRIGALEYTFAHTQGPAEAQAPVASIVLAAARRNATPWIAFQGDIDQVCDAGKTRQFVTGTGHAGLVRLPNVGHGFSVERNWLPQFRSAYARLTTPAKPSPATGPTLGDLPLTTVPATAGATPATHDLFAVLLSGDGGWAGLDQDVAAALA